MVKYPLIALIASVCIYFISSFMYPVWGERAVVTVMILCIFAAGASIILLTVLLVRQRRKK